jgi:hypothetical protein
MIIFYNKYKNKKVNKMQNRDTSLDKLPESIRNLDGYNDLIYQINDTPKPTITYAMVNTQLNINNHLNNTIYYFIVAFVMIIFYLKLKK